ncbi:response regulator transcription factor [Novosphingobium terrae]|uniref:response regulator transcription factor n=1 Tax=Novosphingobium terrae TaxID=2726189 RepID=UPI00198181EA|nr:response regulator transcription factor [Novosphingobium terrae]
MKILFLEDDDVLLKDLVQALEEAKHSVTTCKSGQAAIYLAGSRDYHVLIFDRMVDGIDGLNALRILRSKGVRTPALFLTAMTGVDDRVDGLEAGADDYLAKPFAVRELLARVMALGRRGQYGEASASLVVGDIEIDRLKRSVTRAGIPVLLQVQEFKLLEYLMLHAGQVVTRSMLLEGVWSYHFDVRTNIVESHMSRLRAKLCANGSPDPIQTLRRIGYRFETGQP